MVVRRRGVYSFAEFLELVPADQKADLIEGVIYPMSPENLEHNDLVGWLYAVLREYVGAKQLGRVTLNRVAYRLTPTSAPEPDVAVVLTSRIGVLRDGYVDGPPDVAVEVVSPESVERDYEQKRELYAAAGVREYWIVDPQEKSALFLRADASHGGTFAEAELEGKVFHSRTLPGFWLDSRWLVERPLPPALRIVQRLLGQEA